LGRSSEPPEVNVGELLEKLKLLARNPKLKEWAEKSGSELMAELNGECVAIRRAAREMCLSSWAGATV
jgi:hypothetical protein